MNEREESINKFGFVGMKMKVKLGTLGEIFIGLTYKPEDVSDEGTIVLRSSNIQNGKLDFEDIVRVQSNIKDKLMVKDGDILMCSRNGSARLVGKTAMIKDLSEPMTFGAFMTIIRTNKNSYLQYYFKSDYFRRQLKGSTTTTINQITRNMLLDMEVPLLTESESAEIVNRLGRIENIINKRNQELQALDNLIKARFVELFGDPIRNPYGWKKQRFDTLCENLDARRKPITASEREEGMYPYYGASGVVDHVVDYLFDEDILLVSEDGANLLMRSTPIAFSVSGKVWVNNHAHVVKFEKMSMQKYIEVYFSMIDISEQITGSAQPKLNQAKLNSMMFAVPDETRLEEFLLFVTQVDKSKVAVQKALDEAQLLFCSLMQKYFG